MGWTVDTEQRQSRRVCVELPVRFAVLGCSLHDSERYLHACTSNLSVSGVGFVTALAMPIRSRVRLMLSIPGSGEEVLAEGTVVRILADRPENDGIEYGVRFDGTEPRAVLERFIRAIDILPLLKLMQKQNATDLHLSVNTPPLVRIDNRLVPASDKSLSADGVESLVSGVLSPQQRSELRRKREVLFPFTVPGLGRWRVSVFYQRGYVEAALHTINQEIPTLEQLGLPESVSNLMRAESGLILITGAQGSGKSATLAALIEAVNRDRTVSITTLENPIEYVLSNRRSMVRQREVGIDVGTFAEGLRSALSQDADVIAVSEVSTPDTAEWLIRAVESGRLVLAVVPTLDAVQTIERLLAWLPADQRKAALHVLSAHLHGIISQRLLPRAEGQGLALAVEVAVANDAIRSALNTDRLDTIPALVRTAPEAQPLDASLRALVMKRMVNLEVAASYAVEPDRLRRAVYERV